MTALSLEIQRTVLQIPPRAQKDWAAAFTGATKIKITKNPPLVTLGHSHALYCAKYLSIQSASDLIDFCNRNIKKIKTSLYKINLCFLIRTQGWFIVMNLLHSYKAVKHCFVFSYVWVHLPSLALLVVANSEVAKT